MREACFNEAAGADPADASSRSISDRPESRSRCRFNEAAGADPADASVCVGMEDL